MPRLLPTALAAACLAAAASLRAELPLFSIERVEDFFPPLGPTGDPSFPNRTVVYGVSAGGNGYLAAFADFENPVTPPDSQIVTPSETNYIVDSTTLGVERTGAPPQGYVTGTSGALRASSAGHIVFSVSGEADRNTPGWLERIQVARANPDGTTEVLPGGQGIEQRGVNASGAVIGTGPEDASAWIYTDALGWQSIGALGPSGYAHPRGINDSGTVVGRTENADGNIVPFYYTMEEGMMAITNGGAAVFGEAAAVNNAGLVTGTGNGRAFLFDAATLELTFLTPAADQRAVDINEAGMIIGVFNGPPFMGIPGSAAWVATLDDGFQPLENLIGQDLLDPEWRVFDAFDINDDGWILASAFNIHERIGYQVLLRPIPEPAGALLVLVTAAFLGRRGRYRRAA